MLKIAVFLFFILSTPILQAKVDIPRNLSDSDRLKVLDILGFGTNSRISTDNYPLGGYAGFEIGFAMNFVPVSDLANLGDTVTKQDIFRYPILSIGKGLYNNIDLFIHFMPYSEGTGLSEYGGQLRWGFFQFAYVPISFSLLLSANSANINNQLITKNIGYDLVAGITTRSLYFYLGGGQVATNGDFTGGGTNGITDSGVNEKETLNDEHFMTGIGFRIDPFFLNLQLDYFNYPSYTAKFGLRY